MKVYKNKNQEPGMLLLPLFSFLVLFVEYEILKTNMSIVIYYFVFLFAAPFLIYYFMGVYALKFYRDSFEIVYRIGYSRKIYFDKITKVKMDGEGMSGLVLNKRHESPRFKIKILLEGKRRMLTISIPIDGFTNKEWIEISNILGFLEDEDDYYEDEFDNY